MNICIIDDEKDNRDLLIYFIQTQYQDIQILGEAACVKDGIHIINTYKPDLIFLDIEMPDGTGFDLVDNLTEYLPEIIFYTAYNQFALRAIECSALGYLIKPINKTTVEQVITKAAQKIDLKNKALQYQVLKEQISVAENNSTRFLISNSDGMHVLNFDNLIYCTADSNYTTLHLEDKKIIVAKTLKEIEIILSNHTQFLRIHHSTIVNISKIIKIQRVEQNIFVLLKNNIELAVSRSKRDMLNKIFHTG